MGNGSSSSQSEDVKRKKYTEESKTNKKKRQNDRTIGCSPFKKKRHSSINIISNENKILPQENTLENFTESTNESKFIRIWICRNRQFDQRKEFNLEFSSSLNILIEYIYKYFDEITEDMTLTIFSDEDTWLEIRTDDKNIPLIDLGITDNSTMSIEKRLPIDDDVNNLPLESNKTILLTIKDISFNRDIQIECNENITLAQLQEKIRSEIRSDFQFDYLQISTPCQSVILPEENHISSSVSILRTSAISTVQSNNIEKPVKTDGHYGLHNLGNTCFMNSALQSLSNIELLTDHFLINKNIVGDLAEAYRDFIEHIWKYGKLYNPKSIRRCICYYAPQFDNYQQHDAHEFLILLLNQLHEDLKDKEQMNSIISQLFKCQIDTITTCLTCKKIRRTPNSMNFVPLSLDNEKKKRYFQIYFTTIQISIKINANNCIKDLVRKFLIQLKEQTNSSIDDLFQRLIVISFNTNEELVFETSLNDVLDSQLKIIVNNEILRDEKLILKQQTKSIELIDCFKEFAALETPNYQWFCKMECNQPVYTAKRMLLSILSPVLIIQLKRFTEANGYIQKLDRLVKFPIDGLDLKLFMIDQNEEILYDLIAVVNHMGNIHHGHYTTYARQLNDPFKKWFCFNDELVTSIEQDEIISNSAYILIYIKRQ